MVSEHVPKEKKEIIAQKILEISKKEIVFILDFPKDQTKGNLVAI